jgi:hypothetical protein
MFRTRTCPRLSPRPNVKASDSGRVFHVLSIADAAETQIMRAPPDTEIEAPALEARPSVIHRAVNSTAARLMHQRCSAAIRRIRG